MPDIKLMEDETDNVVAEVGFIEGEFSTGIGADRVELRLSRALAEALFEEMKRYYTSPGVAGRFLVS